MVLVFYHFKVGKTGGWVFGPRKGEWFHCFGGALCKKILIKIQYEEHEKKSSQLPSRTAQKVF